MQHQEDRPHVRIQLPAGTAPTERTGLLGNSERRSTGHRFVFLDLFRGTTLFAMILANTSTEGSFEFLIHKEWLGWSFADTIFPSFLFIVGVSIPISLDWTKFAGTREDWRKQSLLRVTQRSLTIMGLGIGLNAIGYFTDRFLNQEDHVRFRIPGVLQRISICYLVTAMYHLATSVKRNTASSASTLSVDRSLIMSMSAHRRPLPRSVRIFTSRSMYYCLLLISVWLLCTIFISDCDPKERTSLWQPHRCTAQAAIDSKLIGWKHLYHARSYDPEGLLSTLTAIVTTHIGYVTGIYLLKHKPILSQPFYTAYALICPMLLISTAILLPFAYLLQFALPISKNLWTPTFVMVTSATSLAAFACSIYITHIRYPFVTMRISAASDRHLQIDSSSSIARFDVPQSLEQLSITSSETLISTVKYFVAYGRNPILIYMMSELLNLGFYLSASSMHNHRPGPPGKPDNSMDIFLDNSPLSSDDLPTHSMNGWVPLLTRLGRLLYSLVVAFGWGVLALYFDKKGWYVKL